MAIIGRKTNTIIKMPAKDLFIPNYKEKKRATLVRNEYLLSYVFFIIALLISSSFIALSIPNILGYATDITTNDLLNYTNTRRAKEGLPSLKMNSSLSKAAEMKANDMFENDYWAHTSPTGKEPWDFIVSTGYDYLYAGENLAVDFSHSKSVVEAWYESPSHKANLMNDKYTEIGFAVVNGELQGRKTTLVVQMFGYPRKQPVNVAAEGSDKSPSLAVAGDNRVNEAAKNDLNINVNTTQPEINEITGEEDVLQNEIPTDTYLVTAGVRAEEGSVLNTATVFSFSRFVAIVLGVFVTAMFAFDGIYVRRNGILRLTGHTFLHIALLIFALVGMWYTTIGLVL